MGIIRLFMLLSVFLAGMAMGQMSFANDNSLSFDPGDWIESIKKQAENLVDSVQGKKEVATLPTVQSSALKLYIRPGYKLRKKPGLSEGKAANTSDEKLRGQLKFISRSENFTEPDGRVSRWYFLQDTQTGDTYVINSAGVPKETQDLIEEIPDRALIAQAAPLKRPTPRLKVQKGTQKVNSKKFGPMLCNSKLYQDHRIGVDFDISGFQYNKSIKPIGTNRACAQLRISANPQTGEGQYRYYVNGQSSCYKNYVQSMNSQNKKPAKAIDAKGPGQFCITTNKQGKKKVIFRAAIPMKPGQTQQKWFSFHIDDAPQGQPTRNIHEEILEEDSQEEDLGIEV